MQKTRALSAAAFSTLLLVAFIMGANHVAARLAFNHSVDVATAVAFRSIATAIVVSIIIYTQRIAFHFKPQHKRALPLIGVLIGMQSLFIYSSVARLPVALALLAFNTYPIWTAVWDRVLYRKKPEKFMVIAMPFILFGLALALDVLGATSGLGFDAHWKQIGTGVGFGIAAAATFGLALVITQHEASDVDGRVRTATTMIVAGLMALISVGIQGGFHLPTAPLGWVGLGALMALYGTGFTIMFTVLPKLGVAGNSAIMNVEPIFALALAWLFLDQSVATIQVVGAAMVVGTVLVLGLRKK